MDREVYIVANKEQEHEVLDKLIKIGYKHPHTDEKKYTFTPSVDGTAFMGFPYWIYPDDDKHLIYWSPDDFYEDSKELIVFDGRNDNDSSRS